jgi:hypothetical protein
VDESWRLRPNTTVDMWERDIRDWIERQGTPESKRWDESSGSILWHFCALFLQRHSRSACTRVHLFVGRLYRKVRKKDDRMLTFEETCPAIGYLSSVRVC